MMKDCIQSAMRGQVGRTLQLLILLLLAGGAGLYITALTGCGSCSGGDELLRSRAAKPDSAEAPAFEAKINTAQRVAAPGQTVTRTLSYNGSPSGSMVTYYFTPPRGSTNVEFRNLGTGGEVLGPDGEGRYRVYVPSGTSPEVSYSVDPNAEVGTRKLDIVTVEDATTRARDTTIIDTLIVAPGGSAAAETPPAVALDAPGAAAITAWHIGQYLYPEPPQTVAQAECQDWVDFVQSKKVWLGFRAPLQQTPGAPSYRLPVLFTHPMSATIAVMGTPMQAALEYRPERLEFMQNNLPAGASNEFWVPLGVVVTPTVTCPAGNLNWEAGGNEIYFDLYLNLPFEERVLPVYLCYEGEDGPPGVSAADLALARVAGALGGVGALGFQDEGITCLGPHYEPLKPTMFGPLARQWEIHGTHFATITRTQTISLELHALKGDGLGTVSLTFQHSSDLGSAVSWGLYHNANRTQPVTSDNPLVLHNDSTPFYAIATVPGDDTAPKPGPYTLVVTATQGVTSAVHSVLLWMGAWTPPPGGKQYVYLPVVRKN